MKHIKGDHIPVETETPVEQQIVAFEEQNPQIADAMRVFGITMTRYQGSLNAVYGPRTYQSTSTTALYTVAPEKNG